MGNNDDNTAKVEAYATAKIYNKSAVNKMSKSFFFFLDTLLWSKE